MCHQWLLARVHVYADLGGREAIGLVLDVRSEALQLGQVLAAVVCAEEQLATRTEASTHVRPGATAVAAVGRGQTRCQCSCHVYHPFVVVGPFAVLPGVAVSSVSVLVVHLC